MNKFKAFLWRLMYGRYGIDKLYTGLFVIFIIMTLVNMFIANPIVNLILSLLNTATVVFMFYRVFSKQIYKRRREEQIYLSIIGKIKRPFSVTKRKFKDRKTHVYKKCPSCKTQLRFPKKKGTIMVTCPKCREQFKMKL